MNLQEQHAELTAFENMLEGASVVIHIMLTYGAGLEFEDWCDATANERGMERCQECNPRYFDASENTFGLLHSLVFNMKRGLDRTTPSQSVLDNIRFGDVVEWPCIAPSHCEAFVAMCEDLQRTTEDAIAVASLMETHRKNRESGIGLDENSVDFFSRHASTVDKESWLQSLRQWYQGIKDDATYQHVPDALNKAMALCKIELSKARQRLAFEIARTAPPQLALTSSGDSEPLYLGIILNAGRRTIRRHGIDAPERVLSLQQWELLTAFIASKANGVTTARLLKIVDTGNDAVKQAVTSLRREIAAFWLSITAGNNGQTRVLIELSTNVHA